MATTAQNVDVPLTLHISAATREVLTRRAAAAGTDVEGYVSSLVERNAAAEGFSLAEISGPVYERFVGSGTTDDELAEELERGKHELRAERRGRGRATP